MCAGCGAPVVARHILRALKEDDFAVIANATGCMEVSTFIYPYTAWTDSFIHTAFENAGATLSGAEAAYVSMKKQGKLPEDGVFIGRTYRDTPSVDGFIFVNSDTELLSGQFVDVEVTGYDEYDLIGDVKL